MVSSKSWLTINSELILANSTYTCEVGPCVFTSTNVRGRVDPKAYPLIRLLDGSSLIYRVPPASTDRFRYSGDLYLSRGSHVELEASAFRSESRIIAEDGGATITLGSRGHYIAGAIIGNGNNGNGNDGENNNDAALLIRSYASVEWRAEVQDVIIELMPGSVELFVAVTPSYQTHRTSRALLSSHNPIG